MKKLICKTIVIIFTVMAIGVTAHAAPLSIFDGSWTQFANDDGVGRRGFVNPGWGGQDFDAEYFYYKLNGSSLSIGLQTGYDLIDGHQYISKRDYYAGDMALSFDGDSSNYEYAVDFGLLTKDYYNHKVGNNKATTGIDAAGLYSVASWNSHIPFGESAPFAMDSGTLIGGLSQNEAGSDYYRIVTFNIYDIPGILPDTAFMVDAHWTMSCGNDAIDGGFEETVPVPEPTTLILLGTGCVGFIITRRKKGLSAQD